MITNKNIDNGNSFDWGFASQQYAQFRDIYPSQLYDRLHELGVAADGITWLDLGTGTGVLPQNMYNPNAEITGIDISDEQIRFAKMNAEKHGWDIDYIVAPAEKTNFPDNSFDAITAAQCFGYFERDKMKSEIRRMLIPGGIFVKVYLTDTLDDEIAKKSHELVKNYKPDWTPQSGGLKKVFDELFDGRITESFDCDLPFTRESWHGRMCACRGTLASMDKETFEKWNEAHLKMLSHYPENFRIKHKLYITYFRL